MAAVAAADDDGIPPGDRSSADMRAGMIDGPFEEIRSSDDGNMWNARHPGGQNDVSRFEDALGSVLAAEADGPAA